MKDKIQQYIAAGKVEKAFELLPKTQDFILLQGRFKRNKADNMKGIISRSDFEMENNRILYAILDLVDELDNEALTPSTDNSTPKTPETKTPTTPVVGKKVFLSYSHEDEVYKNELDVHLSMLKRSGKITTWNDRSIMGGEIWDDKIMEELSSSDIILLLISANFIASDYIWKQELPLVFRLQQEGKCKVIPVIVRPSDWKESEFARFQAFPRDGKPISTYQNKDEAYTEVVEGIKRVIETP